jgi:hypothetical protein
MDADLILVLKLQEMNSEEIFNCAPSWKTLHLYLNQIETYPFRRKIWAIQWGIITGTEVKLTKVVLFFLCEFIKFLSWIQNNEVLAKVFTYTVRAFKEREGTEVSSSSWHSRQLRCRNSYNIGWFWSSNNFRSICPPMIHDVLVFARHWNNQRVYERQAACYNPLCL